MNNNNFVDISNVKMPKNLPKFNYYKKTKEYDVAISLFETCNLNCKFCFEKHNTPIDVDKIMSMPKNIIDGIAKDINAYKPDNIVFRIWGGELFSDNIDDSMFQVYRDFVKNISELAKINFPWINTNIAFLTNGVWKNKTRVESLIRDTNAALNFSYDPVLRFHNNEQKNIWENNFYYFNKLGLSNLISITLTKPNIIEYINGDSIFDRIPSFVQIDANYYVPNQNWEEYMPSDEDLFSFFKWAIDNNKFNIISIEEMMRHMIKEEADFVSRCCNCKMTRQCQGEGIPKIDCAANVSKVDRKRFYGELENECNEENCTEIKNSLGLIKRGCVTCEHFKNCHQMCWVSLIFDGYKVTKCPLKQVYEYITEQDIERYKQWRKNDKNGITLRF